MEHEFVSALEAAGFDQPTANPVWGLILVGLADQQIANDPGGDQWWRLVDPVADMFWAQFRPKRRSAR